MSPSVKRKFPALAEALGAAVDSTHEGLLVSVSVLVLSQVLGECENLRAELALERFLVAVDIIVSLEGKLGGEALAAAFKLTFVFEVLNFHGIRGIQNRIIY